MDDQFEQLAGVTAGYLPRRQALKLIGVTAAGMGAATLGTAHGLCFRSRTPEWEAWVGLPLSSALRRNPYWRS